MIRVGIIGCGKIAQLRHIPEYADNPNAEIAGYYDFNMERAKELADKYGGKAYESAEKMFSDKTINAVSICTANSVHADLSIKAMEAGKHVLCEKPMAMTIKDCERMVETAKKYKRTLMIGQNQRLTKAHLLARSLIQSGEIGKVITFRTTFGHGGPETWSIDGGTNTWFFDKNKSVMGSMADLGVHKTDLIQYLLDAKVVETTAKVMTLDKKDSEGNLVGVDDNAICIYRMDNGAIGTMTASWTYYGEEDNSTVLYGTEGMMKIYVNKSYSIEITAKDGKRILYDIEKIQTNDNQTKSGIIDAFLEALREGKKSPIEGADVLAAMRAVFASIESSEKNKSIQVKID